MRERVRERENDKEKQGVRDNTAAVWDALRMIGEKICQINVNIFEEIRSAQMCCTDLSVYKF